MAYDKAVDSAKLDAGLTAVANAIRAKGGTSAPLEFPQGMAEAIAAIEGGGGIPGDSTALDILQNIPGQIIKNSEVTELSYGVSNRSDITGIDFPNVVSVHRSAFFGCSNLANVNLPKAVNIYFDVFHGANEIRKISFPAAEYFANSAFIYCRKLETMILPGNKVVRIENVGTFRDSGISNGTGFVYVPKSLVEQYKTATNWVAYADQIRAIEDYPEITGGAK